MPAVDEHFPAYADDDWRAQQTTVHVPASDPYEHILRSMRMSAFSGGSHSATVKGADWVCFQRVIPAT